MPYTDDDKKRDYRNDYYAKNKRVYLTLSDEENTLLELQASKANMKKAELAREILLSRLYDSPIVYPDMEEKLTEFNILVRNIANNVNQIAKHSNTVKYLVDDEEKRLIQNLALLARSITDFVHDKAK